MVKLSSKNAIDVVIYTKLELTSECIQLLLESKSEVRVVDFASSSEGLIKIVSDASPHVVLFVLSDPGDNATNVIVKVVTEFPSTKALVLSDLNGNLDQSLLLRSGASGIVGTHQKEEIIIRAIRRVAEGEVWFSQELIARIVRNGTAEQDRSSNPCGEPDYQELTSRELDVVHAIVEGKNNKEISKSLNISEATVRHHLSSIYSKLYIEDRLNLVIYAFQKKLFPKSPDDDGNRA